MRRTLSMGTPSVPRCYRLAITHKPQVCGAHRSWTSGKNLVSSEPADADRIETLEAAPERFGFGLTIAVGARHFPTYSAEHGANLRPMRSTAPVPSREMPRPGGAAGFHEAFANGAWLQGRARHFPVYVCDGHDVRATATTASGARAWGNASPLRGRRTRRREPEVFVCRPVVAGFSARGVLAVEDPARWVDGDIGANAVQLAIVTHDALLIVPLPHRRAECPAHAIDAAGGHGLEVTDNRGQRARLGRRR